MGLVYANIKLSNPLIKALNAVHIKAKVKNIEILHLCISENIAKKLKLDLTNTRKYQDIKGAFHNLPYVGPIRIDFEDRFCYTGAIVVGKSTILGGLPMVEMDIVLIPGSSNVIVNLQTDISTFL